jgi:hypothetical protein
MLVAGLGALGLAGCGGGDDDETGIEVLPDGRVLAGSDAITPEDYVGRTFPVLFTSARDAEPQATTEVGQGSVEVVDADTIVITLPGRAARTFDRISSTEFSDGFGDVLTFEDDGAAQYFVQTDGDPADLLLGAYGFETPVTSRPLSARYGATSASVLVYVPDGSTVGYWLGAPGSVDLLATFTGSGGRIQGTLFDTTATVDFAGDGIADDELSARVTLDGVIDAAGFGGTVDGSASVALAGSADAQDLGLVLSNSAVDGKFFGTKADIAAGNYAADTDLTRPGGGTETGKLTGFFIADR